MVKRTVNENGLALQADSVKPDIESGGSSTLGDIAISARNISKMYPLYARPNDRLKQSLWYALPRFLRGQQPPEFYKEFWALRDVSFELKRGEVLGIIGRNGSGKSTLLQIIAGTLAPTHGEVQVNGRVAALLELGSGFNPEFTGRENVYLNGAILGFSREEMDGRFDEIAAFADIGQFMDQPVKHYSSGMFVRLAFAVQACVEPDILIVDEALSVGDIFFQQKCHDRMEKLLGHDTAIILVSHDMPTIEKYSTVALLLDQGNPVFVGQPNEAVQRYYWLNLSEKHSTSPADSISTNHSRLPKMNVSNNDDKPSIDWPSETAFLDIENSSIIGGELVRCTGIALCDGSGQPGHVFEMGDTANFYYELEVLEDIDVPVGGVVITNAMNINVHGKNSAQYSIQAPSQISKGTRVRFQQTIQLSLAPGRYTFSVGFSTISAADSVYPVKYAEYNEKSQILLIVQQAGSFEVTLRTKGLDLPFHGIADLAGSFKVGLVESIQP